VVRNPIYSTGVGLLMYGLQKQSDGPVPDRHQQQQQQQLWR
jgi:cell division ATPase FtsA